jgi:hypothetical protein
MNILFYTTISPVNSGISRRGHQVVAIGGSMARMLPGIPLHRHRLVRGRKPSIQLMAVRFGADCLRGEAAAGAAALRTHKFLRPIASARAQAGSGLHLWHVLRSASDGNQKASSAAAKKQR